MEEVEEEEEMGGVRRKKERDKEEGPKRKQRKLKKKETRCFPSDSVNYHPGLSALPASPSHPKGEDSG